MTQKARAEGGTFLGLYTAVPAYAIPDDATPYCRNVDFTRVIGAASKRLGYADYGNAAPAGSAIASLYEFILEAGTTFIMASVNDDVYNTAGAWTSIFTDGDLDGGHVDMATFDDLLIFVATAITTQKWDGVAGSSSNLGGTPPANAKHVIVFKNRVFMANTSAGKSRLHWSAAGNAEDWTTANDAGFQDIDKESGDEIVGLAVVGGTLLIFKRRSVHACFGSGPSTFTFRKLEAAKGCASKLSIVDFGTFVVYLSDEGVHSISEGAIFGELHDNIRYDIEALPAKTIAAAGRSGKKYILCYDSDANSANDSAYVLDLVGGQWSPWTNYPGKVFCTRLDGTLLMGRANVAHIATAQSGESDDGSAIDMIYRTKQFDGADVTALKTVTGIWVHTKPIAAKTLTIRTLLDGVQVDELSPSIAATQIASTDRTEKVLYVPIASAQANQARFLQFEFRNNEASAPVQIYRFAAPYTMEPEARQTT